MTTQDDIILNVRSRLDEPSAQQFTDTDLMRWINEATKDVARRTETLQTTAIIAALSGVQQYTAPIDVIRIYRVEYIDTNNNVTPLDFRDFNNMDSVWWSTQLTATGTPMLYTMWGFPPTLKIILYPAPANNTDSIKVYYYRTATELAIDGTAGATTLDIPAGREELILDYVEYCALRKDRDPRWQEAKSLYEEKVQQMYEQTRRWTDQAGMMVMDNLPLHPFIWNEDWV